MKQKDIALVLVMVFVGAVLALLTSQLIFSAPKNRTQKAEVVDVITPDFPAPPSKYFNVTATNPTQPITLGADKKP